MAASRVVILGGGLAGMAAGVRLSEAGFAVTLIEKRNVLGGRASSFTPPGESASIDNCQHVLLGCCTNLLDFLSRIDSAHQIKFYRRFHFIGQQGLASLWASPLPAPLHFLPSILRFQHLSLADRCSLIRAIHCMMRTPQPFPDRPFHDWLREQKQSEAVISNFWRPIMTSALNEEPECLSTRPAFHVVIDSFVRNRRGYWMGVPRAPLSEMYSVEKVRRFMSIRLRVMAASARVESQRVARIVLQGDETVEADYYLSALPPDALSNLLGSTQHESWTQLDELKALEWSPITGIHLWYDRQVMSAPHLVVAGKTIQWIFNKSADAVGPHQPPGHNIQIVISASRSLLSMKREEIIDLVSGELSEVLPESKTARLEKVVIVKEAESTPCFPPGFEATRPGPLTPFRNLFLAGDWTATGWPPTMESAVRSGYRAAECIAAAAGMGVKFVIPDLPTDPLAKLLLA